VWVKFDKSNVTENNIKLSVEGFTFNSVNKLKKNIGALKSPDGFAVKMNNRTAFSR